MRRVARSLRKKKSPRKRSKSPSRGKECSRKLYNKCMECFPREYDTRDADARTRQERLRARMNDPDKWMRDILRDLHR